MLQHVLLSMNEVITTNYDSNHAALDIVSSDHSETDIIALESGTVTAVVKNIQGTDNNSKGIDTYGNFVKIKQDNGKTALYAHLKFGSINVTKGMYITKGTIIGTMGETGNAYGKHLHLEIKNEYGINENPIISLNEVSIEKPQTEDNSLNEENINQNNTVENESAKDTTEPNQENTPNNQINYDISSSKSEDQNPETNVFYHYLTPNTQYLSNFEYKEGSIVDALKNINIDSSYDYRKLLAEKNGIENYHGSYTQNVKLLKLLKEGNLIKA